MSIDARSILSGIATMRDMTLAFRDEGRCRQLLEALVWPNGRICPACGFRKSVALTGRGHGQARSTGIVSVLKRRLPPPVYGDDANAIAFNQVAVADVVDRSVACSSVG
jgi:hypothetical protein